MGYLDLSGLSHFLDKIKTVFAAKKDTILDTTLSRGRKTNTTIGEGSFAFGDGVEASGAFSHAEGKGTVAGGAWAHAEGNGSHASGNRSHAEGTISVAQGLGSHAEGMATTASGMFAHTEGSGATGSGDSSHAEGNNTTASGYASHAEGNNTTASGGETHAEGIETIASQQASHVEGMFTIARGLASHVSGISNVEDSYTGWPEWTSDTEYAIGDKVKVTTTANNETTIQGYICKTANSDASFTASKWINQAGKMNFAEIVGNGENGGLVRSNARALDWDGNEYLAGDVYVHAGTDSTGGVKLATVSDIPDMSDKADKTDTVLNTTLSRGRKANSTVGTASVAFGDNVEASGDMSFAIGKDTIAEGNYSVAEGLGGTYETGDLDENDEPIAIISSAGYASHTEGMQTFADNRSHAEGYRTQAINTSHAEGYETYAEGGFGSHAEGYQTAAKGGYSSHAEGHKTLASGAYGSHAEGKNTIASGGHAHAEGDSTRATSDGAHAEGSNSKATASDAHAEGIFTQASAQAAHAEGYMSVASGMRSHTEGQYTIAAGSYSHTSGMNNVADSYKNWPEWTAGTEYEVGDKVKRTTTSGGTTTVKGYICNTANSDSSFSSSKWTDQNGRMNYAEIIGNGKDQNNRSNARALDWNGNEYLSGDVYVHAGSNSTGGTKLATVSDIADLSNKADKTDTILNTTLSRGRKENTTVGTGSFAFGDNVEASGAQSHAEGGGTTASGNNSHAEGENTSATEWDAHAEGWATVASGTASHSEGRNTIASGIASHAEGYLSQSAGFYSHAEGSETASNGVNSHAEGQSTIANAQDSHVGGRFNNPDSYSNWPEWISGASYSVGDKVKVADASATAQGYICKVANSDTTAPGLNGNKWDFWQTKMNYIEIIGNGSSNNSRSNARTLDWDGNERLMGDVYVGCNADSTGGTKLAKITDIPAVATIAETQAIISEYGVSA